MPSRIQISNSSILCRHGFAISRPDTPEFYPERLALRDQRAQGMPGARCARSLACEIKKAHERSHHGHTGSPGIPYAMVLTVSFALSPVTGLVCHRHRRKLPSANLTPASGRQDHTTSPSASRRSRQQRRLRPPHPVPNVRDDRETPLCSGRDDSLYSCFYQTAKRKIFAERAGQANR